MQIETPLFSSNVPEAVKAIEGRKEYFLEKRRKVKADEPVEDADWEKAAKPAANGAGPSGKTAPKQDGFSDISDWPGVFALSCDEPSICHQD